MRGDGGDGVQVAETLVAVLVGQYQHMSVQLWHAGTGELPARISSRCVHGLSVTSTIFILASLDGDLAARHDLVPLVVFGSHQLRILVR